MPDDNINTNELSVLLKKIQYKTGFTLTEIAEKIQYSRSYVSKAMKREPVAQRNVLGRLKEVFADVLIESGPGRLASYSDALQVVMMHRLARLLSDQSGRSEVVEIESMKKDAQDLLGVS